MFIKIILPLLFLFLCGSFVFGQNSEPSGTVRGVVKLAQSEKPVQNAVMTVAELKKSVLTDENGAFEIRDVPFGKYQIIAHLDRVPDAVKTVEVSANGAINLINR